MRAKSRSQRRSSCGTCRASIFQSKSGGIDPANTGRVEGKKGWGRLTGRDRDAAVRDLAPRLNPFGFCRFRFSPRRALGTYASSDA